MLNTITPFNASMRHSLSAQALDQLVEYHHNLLKISSCVIPPGSQMYQPDTTKYPCHVLALKNQHTRFKVAALRFPFQANIQAAGTLATHWCVVPAPLKDKCITPLLAQGVRAAIRPRNPQAIRCSRTMLDHTRSKSVR